MKFQALQQDLAKSLSIASRFVNPKAQLPVLSNIKLVAKATKLLIQATNLETSSSLTLGAKVEKEGEIALPARSITEIISNLPPETVTIEAQQEAVKISSSNFNATLASLNAKDFPQIPSQVSSGHLTLPSKDFFTTLDKVIFACSTDITRPVLTGSLFIFGDNLQLVATDGFRLSKKTINLPKKTTSSNLIIPKSFLIELSRLSALAGESIKLEAKTSDNLTLFEVGDVVLSTRTIEGQFPDFEKIIPKASSITVDLDKQELAQNIRLAAVFARDSANTIRLKVTDKNLTISAQSQKSGTQEASLDAKVDGGQLEIAYNYRFIEEFLNVVESDSVSLGFTSANSPGIFKDPSDPDFLHLIMPVKI